MFRGNINVSQSTNDTFPTAMHIVTVFALEHQVRPQIDAFLGTLERKAAEWQVVVKVTRNFVVA